MINSSEVKEIVNVIDESLNSHVYLKGKYQKRIYEAIKYSLFTGGKRLRPILAIKTFEVFNSDYEKILPYASALEMIHTYSLIHDDLPSMDNDKIRRGNPTTHMVFGEAIAILAGDGLLNLAYETMIKDTINSSKEDRDYKKRLRVMSIISACAGIEGMIGGQVVDMLATDEDINEDRLEFMHSAKTSALIEASVLAGAILGEAEEREIEIMHKFAKNIGHGYQIKDDFLDMAEDEKLNKSTFISLKDNIAAQKKLDKLTDEALLELDRLEGRDVRFLKELTIELVNRKL